MTWINSLKVAIIEEDIDSISKILDELPNFQDIDEAKEALSLVKSATAFAKIQRQKTLDTMNKIKQTKKFLNS